MVRPVSWCAIGMLLVVCVTSAAAQDPAEPPDSLDKEQIAEALRITRAAAEKYDFVVGGEDAATATLSKESLLRWSNPAAGEIHGNVFLWTEGGRPAVVGSLFQWFSPHTHMSHEFHSLSETTIRGRYEKNNVWTTRETGVKFRPIPEAPAPAGSAAQRLLQLRKLAKSFSATKKERDGNVSELRLLPQPIYRYELAEEGLLDGALFTLVQGTDPEVFLLIEARGQEDKPAVWHFAATRMNGVEFRLRYDGREVWVAEILPWRDITSHRETYTSFRFE